MTTADFNLACTDIHFFTVAYGETAYYLDCPGHYGCPKCVFNSKSTSDDCYIQDRDKLTLKQLAKLQTNYPELFLWLFITHYLLTNFPELGV